MQTAFPSAPPICPSDYIIGSQNVNSTMRWLEHAPHGVETLWGRRQDLGELQRPVIAKSDYTFFSCLAEAESHIVSWQLAFVIGCSCVAASAFETRWQDLRVSDIILVGITSIIPIL